MKQIAHAVYEKHRRLSYLQGMFKAAGMADNIFKGSFALNLSLHGFSIVVFLQPWLALVQPVAEVPCCSHPFYFDLLITAII